MLAGVVHACNAAGGFVSAASTAGANGGAEAGAVLAIGVANATGGATVRNAAAGARNCVLSGVLEDAGVCAMGTAVVSAGVVGAGRIGAVRLFGCFGISARCGGRTVSGVIAGGALVGVGADCIAAVALAVVVAAADGAGVPAMMTGAAGARATRWNCAERIAAVRAAAAASSSVGSGGGAGAVADGSDGSGVGDSGATRFVRARLAAANRAVGVVGREGAVDLAPRALRAGGAFTDAAGGSVVGSVLVLWASVLVSVPVVSSARFPRVALASWPTAVAVSVPACAGGSVSSVPGAGGADPAERAA